MAIKIRYSDNQEVGEALSASQHRRRHTLITAFLFLSRLFLGTAVGAALAFIYLVVTSIYDRNSQTFISSLYFLQSALELTLWHGVASTTGKLLKLSEQQQTPFFAEASRGLRRIASLLLCLPVVGLLFSAAMSFLAYGGVSGVGVILGYAGFPINAAWSALASGSLATDIPDFVTIPLGAFLVPIVLFCISYAFRYGRQLQQNESRTL